MRDLHDVDLRGCLFLYLKPFIQKAISSQSSTLCDSYNQEMGVPEGIRSISSVTLFMVKINNITSCIRNSVDNSLFVDGFGVSYPSKHIQAIERHLNLHLNRIEAWADINGFKFSKSSLSEKGSSS